MLGQPEEPSLAPPLPPQKEAHRRVSGYWNGRIREHSKHFPLEGRKEWGTTVFKGLCFWIFKRINEKITLVNVKFSERGQNFTGEHHALSINLWPSLR